MSGRGTTSQTNTSALQPLTGSGGDGDAGKSVTHGRAWRDHQERCDPHQAEEGCLGQRVGCAEARKREAAVASGDFRCFYTMGTEGAGWA